MKRLVRINRYSTLMVLAVGVLLLAAIPAARAQTTPTEPVGNITISITNDGLVSDIQNPTGGLYVVTVRNDSSVRRGVVLRGIDLCCAPYTRFSKMLNPGQQQTFRWYFPSERSVEIRDLVRCQPTATACSPWAVGNMVTTLPFS